MVIENYITLTFPTIRSSERVDIDNDALKRHGYLVVLDRSGVYRGLITSNNLFSMLPGSAGECAMQVETISTDDSIKQIIDKFERTRAVVLPVFRNHDFVGVFENINLIHLLNNQVETLTSMSKSSQVFRDNILHNLSHEIRTPLNGIIGFMELVERNVYSQPKPFAIIKQCTDRFLVTMNTLTELSLLQAGDTIELNPESFLFTEITEELLTILTYSKELYGKELRLNLVNNNSPIELYTDKLRFRNILFHLIENALKFSPTDSTEVKVGYRIDETINEIHFFITNNGDTIMSADRNRLFDAFVQFDHGNRYNYGLGIGLTLAKEYSLKLGGCIEYECINNQTTFFLKFPSDSILRNSTIHY